VDLAAQLGATWVSRYELREHLTHQKAGSIATLQPGITQSARLTPRRAEKLGIPFVENAFETTMSSDRVDRHGDTIQVPGWKHGAFRKAGAPLLWSHLSFMPPIGNMKALWAETKDEGFRSNRYRGVEAYHLKTRLSEDTYRLVDGDHLRSGSVGFIPLKWGDRKSEDGSRWLGFNFTEQEQLEYSKTPIPANPDALNGKSAEFPGFFKAMEETLDRKPNQWTALERAYFAMKAGGQRMQVHLVNAGYEPDENDDGEDRDEGQTAADPGPVDPPAGQEKKDKGDALERLFDRAEKVATRLEAAVSRLDGGEDKTPPPSNDDTPADPPPAEPPANKQDEPERRFRLRING